jgi:O-acetyl-ADP-ribose deacetylase
MDSVSTLVFYIAAQALMNFARKFFPPTEYDLHGEEWEEVEGGESAENGDSQEKAPAEETAEVEAKTEKAKVEDMPEVPTKDPSGEGPALKKQKPSDDITP